MPKQLNIVRYGYIIPTMDANTPKPALFSLIILIALASVAAVLYTPGIPALQHYFNISSATAEWTISIFMLGYALGQLVYAPITNRIGRKSTLYIGVTLGCMGSLLSALSSPFYSFTLLLIGRFLQAIGTGSGLAMVLIMITDVYSHEESRKVFAYASSAFALLPGIAVYVGGLIVTHLNWQSTFYFLTFYCLLSLILVFRLPETSQTLDKNALKFKRILSAYRVVMQKPRLWGYALQWGFCTSIIYIFASTAPIIAITEMGLSPARYGAFNLLTSAGLLCGTFTAGRISTYLKARQVMTIGITLMSFGSITLLLFIKLTHLTPWELFLPMLLIYFGSSLIVSNASALATKDVSNKASGASLLSFINMSSPVIALFFISFMHARPEQIISEVFVLLVAGISVLLYLTRRQS